MARRIFVAGILVVGAIFLAPLSTQAQPPRAITPAREQIEFFESKIRPVLIKACYECHSAQASKVKGGLYLDSRAGLLQGGDNGPAIVAGDPAKSLLIKALRYQDEMAMPPKDKGGKLPANIIADFEQWVKMGAPDPRTTDTTSWKKLTLEDAKTFWSFKPMQKHPAPANKDAAWAKSDVDRFIRAGLEAKGVQPVGDADRLTLLRRVTFDLAGLPPTPEEIDAFILDKSPDAFEKVVDRLLASKHFGERWGRYWLDVARYAESNGNADNTPFPHAWRYRDYVIKSFNDDKPYNRFVTEQVAGDMLPSKSPAERDELLVATGFLALTSKPRAQNNPDYRMDLVSDQLDVTIRGVLGMTIMCARCHDHKFDPISTRDYYSLAGIFNSAQMLYGAGVKGAKGGGDGGLHALNNGGQAMGVKEGVKVGDAPICIRGDSTKKGDVVPRGFLTVALTPNTKPVDKNKSGRLELAAWLTQPDNPLTSRVIVNRVWQHLFGQGLSRVVDNFGLHGEPPTHPELLDNLALKFQEDGWSIKKLVRSLILTRTYQLGSNHDVANYKTDPDNRLWWRLPSKRLDAEAIRDSMLAVSGKINLSKPESLVTAAVVAKKKKQPAPIAESTYRSIYLPIIRNNLPESLAIFDVADPSLIIGQRDVTTVPAQALYLMNSPFVLEQSKGFADRVLYWKDLDEGGRVDFAIRLAYGRTATTAERERVLRYLDETQKAGNSRQQAWLSFCQTLLASAEFRYVQ